VSTLPQKFNSTEVVNLSVEPDGVQPQNVFSELGSTVRERKLLILLSILAGVLVGAGVLVFIPPRYAAVTTLEVQGVNENFMNMTSVDPQAGTGAYSPNSINIETQIKILESGSLRAPVVDRLQRETSPSLPPQTGFISQVRSFLHIHNNDPVESTRQAIQLANFTVKATNILETRIIALSCESTNPDVAASFVNALAGDYIAQTSELRSVNAQKTSQWLAGQLEETKAKLEQAEAKLQEYVQQNGITVIGDQETLADSKLHILQGNLASLKAETIARKTMLDKVTNAPAEALPDIVQDADLKSYLGRINDLKRARAVLLTKLTPEHEKVKAVDVQIAVLQAAFDQGRQNAIARFRSDYQESEKREQMMSSAYAGEASTITAQSGKMAQYGILKREVDILKLSLNAILQQSNQASVASAIPTESIRVIDSAIAPNVISHPIASEVIAEGAAGGLCLGACLAFLLERRKRRTLARRFADPGRSSILLNIRELGVIPSIADGAKPKRLLGNLPLVNRLSPAPIEGGYLLKESFRMIVASLIRQADSIDQRSVVVVTSPGAGEGKTTIVSNIAKAMSEIGRKVLVVNADLRRPHLDEIFDLTGSPGLSEVLASTQPLDHSYLAGMIKHAAEANIDILPAGSATEQLAKLFYSPRLPLALESLRKQYDCILIDTPPLLQFAEARILGRMTDGVILVLRSGATDETNALAARQMLREDQVTLVGAVLNDFKVSEKNGYYSYYYYGGQKA